MASRHGAGGRSWSEVAHLPMDLPEYFRNGVHTGRGTGHQIATTDSIIPALAKHPQVQKLIAADRICYYAGAKHGRDNETGISSWELRVPVPPSMRLSGC